MAGTAKFSELHLFTINGPCIISVDDVNNPTGLWWGTVKDIKVEGSKGYEYLVIKAEITGGRFKNDGKPVLSDENRGRVPTVNYTVYPDIDSVRNLFSLLLSIKEDYNDLLFKFASFKDFHFQTMKAIGGK